MKTKQEIISTVWDYFIIKSHPQARNTRGCCYRGPKSNCAIGCQIPDELYKEWFEGNSIHNLYMDFPEIKAFFGEENLYFLIKLQTIHDTSFPFIKEELEALAKTENLRLP